MYYLTNLKIKVPINQILSVAIFKPKHKNFLHKIVIHSNLLYYLFICLCARTFFHGMEILRVKVYSEYRPFTRSELKF